MIKNDKDQAIDVTVNWPTPVCSSIANPAKSLKQTLRLSLECKQLLQISTLSPCS